MCNAYSVIKNINDYPDFKIYDDKIWLYDNQRYFDIFNLFEGFSKTTRILYLKRLLNRGYIEEKIFKEGMQKKIRYSTFQECAYVNGE